MRRMIPTVMALFMATSATAQGADPTTLALADLGAAAYLSECPGVGYANGYSDRSHFIEGVRRLNKEGHSRFALATASERPGAVQRDLIRQRLAARGIDLFDDEQFCAFGRQIAGLNDAIGRYLVRR